SQDSATTAPGMECASTRWYGIPTLWMCVVSFSSAVCWSGPPADAARTRHHGLQAICTLTTPTITNTTTNARGGQQNITHARKARVSRYTALTRSVHQVKCCLCLLCCATGGKRLVVQTIRSVAGFLFVIVVWQHV